VKHIHFKVKHIHFQSKHSSFEVKQSKTDAAIDELRSDSCRFFLATEKTTELIEFYREMVCLMNKKTA
jgi:hypothetical protein